MRFAEMMRFPAIVIAFAFLLVACGSGDDSEADDDHPGPDIDDTGDDASGDDTGPGSGCIEGYTKCSGDAHSILSCTDGQWAVSKSCMIEEGRLCEKGACVDPWRYGSPTFDSCAADPNATEMSLAAKAEKYDEIAPRLHIHPDDKRIHHVTIPEGGAEEDATYEDVIDWHPGENDGLWTGLYIASQAFRYAVTHEEAALANLRVMMDGEEKGMRITGVPGNFTREYITPGLTGMSCPSDPMQYVPSADKKDNKWVKVDADGTILIYDADSAQWVRTAHSVPEEFAGYCWLDNVSKDEYSGHMLALGVVWLLVDDKEVRSKAAGLLEEVAVHLMEHDMSIVDWDGRITEHGRFWPTALDDYPGFNAVLGLSYVKMGAAATGRQDLGNFYDNCLLQKSGQDRCLEQFLAFPVSFSDWLWWTGLYIGHDGCKSNWNNFSMMFLGAFTLVWYEHQDIELRALLQDVLEKKMFYHNDNVREMARQHNAAWALVAASMKDSGPGSSGPDFEAVNDAICQLRQFPESKAQPEIDVGEDEFPTDLTCESRFDGEYLTFDPVPTHLRCPDTFVWWGNPYEHQQCTANPQFIRQPADYLLPYWMGRYFGFIGEDW